MKERQDRETRTKARRTLARAESAVRRMPEQKRRLFLAMRVEEASYAEIACREGVSVPEVEVLLAGALVEYWRCLENPRRGWWRNW